MLTPLQAEVRRIIGQLGKDHGFALAGGAALITYGIVDRATEDLDFFAPSGVVVNSFVEQVERHLTSLSFRTERLIEYPQLVRMRIQFEDQELMIDIGCDYRSFPPVATPDGLVMDELDLAGDKLVAFITRRAARDLIDLTALEARHGLETLCRLAIEKDPMFTPTAFLKALEDIENEHSLVANHAAIARWRTELARIAPPKRPDFGIEF